MALPAMEAYPLPKSGELPPSRAPWQLDPARAALLIHDMQGYFVRPFPPGEDPILGAVTRINALRAACRRAGVPVFYTAQPGAQDPRDRGLQRDIWGPGMSAAPTDQAIIAALAPLPDEIVLTKWRYSAFQRTTLEEMLRARGRDQLMITGVYAHIGCLMTAGDAFMRDIEPFFVADATADFTRARHDQAIEYVASRCGVAITTDVLLARLGT